MTKRRAFFGLAFLGALLLLVWAGSIKWPVPGQGGNEMAESGRLQSCGATIRVGTYNIQGAKGLDDERNLKRVADVLVASDLDLIGLNEVRDDVFSHQARELAASLNLAWLYAPTRQKLFDGFGNAVLSRCTIVDYEIVPLLFRYRDSNQEVTARAHRNLVRLKVIMAGRPVTVLVTHLDRSGIREHQLQAVLDEFLATSPSILMGDLNTGHEGALQAMLAEGLASDATASLAGQGLPADHIDHIDWIVTRGLRIDAVGIHPRGASDHPHYWAEVSLEQ
jgi:endonuclease/exonuclease/phosphatase family metal-dependent hydrolase